MPACLLYVRFSNRPIWVKHFQALHRCVVDVARGLALLFGLGTKALPSWDSKTRWNNLLVDLAVNVTAGSRGHTNSPHPSSREGHHSTVGGYQVSPICFDPLWLSRCGDLPGPSELGAGNPYPVHHDRHPPCHGDDRAFQPA